MSRLLHDITYGCRMLRRSPLASMAAIATLGVGIGITTAIFSGVHAVVLRPLPYPEPSRLIAINTFLPKLRAPLVPSQYFAAWQQSGSLEQVAAHNSGSTLTLTGMGEAEQVKVASVTRDFFQVLGIEPVVGRGFTADEDRRGGPRVVVLSHACWIRRFGENRTVLGRSLTLGDRPHTIVGILPAAFRFPGTVEAEFFVPFALPDASEGATYFVKVIGRLRPAVTRPRAKAELAVLAERAAKQLSPDVTAMLAGGRVDVVPLQRQIAGDSRHLLLILLASVGCVLLIACVNVANLQLARITARRREIATRAALGAGRGRLMAQLLTESLLTSVMGFAGAIPLAYWGVSLIRSSRMLRLPNAQSVGIDIPVFIFAMALAVVTGVLCALAAAFAATRLDVNETLKGGTSAALVPVGRVGGRAWLLVSEVALAAVLLVAAGLLARTLWRLTSTDPGFRPERLLTLDVSLPHSRYPADHQQIAYFDAVLERVRSVAGVRSAAVTDVLPLRGFAVAVKAVPERDPGAHTTMAMLAASSKYFVTLGIPVLAGREFDPSDGPNAPGVTIINEASATQIFHESSPIGRRIRIDDEDGTTKSLIVVGVVGNVRQAGLGPSPDAMFYRPHAQLPRSRMTLVVRTVLDPLQLLPTIRQNVIALDRDVPLFDTATMDEQLWASVATPRSNMRLFGIFALLALVLAGIGVYGVMAHAVAQRTREVAIRVALGAKPRAILTTLVRDGVRVALAGIAIGLTGAFLASRLLVHMLYGVRATDLVAFSAVPVVLISVVLFATYIPARRALNVDIARALRSE